MIITNLLTRILLVRSISVTLSNIEDDSNQQISLFERRKLGFVMEGLEPKWIESNSESNSISYTPAGTPLHRWWT